MIYFLDFEDSFNYNILSFLKKLSSVEVFHYSNFSYVKDKIKTGDILCLGPGPGHIDEYSNSLHGIEEIYADETIFKFGLCLGHQLLLTICEKAKLQRCHRPVHGQKVEIPNTGFFNLEQALFVQRYNSWSINENSIPRGNFILDSFGEVAAFKYGNHVYTVQFHPESIGTSCPELFFQPLRDFLRYSKEDGFDQASRNLR
jgi:anthranilate/para-aminobenzoate synthase component II